MKAQPWPAPGNRPALQRHGNLGMLRIAAVVRNQIISCRAWETQSAVWADKHCSAAL